MRIAGALLDELLAHVRDDPRNERCGVVAIQTGEPGRALSVHRATNIHASPLKFEISPKELFALNEQIEREGGELGAIYHSHVRSAPYPSQTDIQFAAGWPGVEWVIVGLADPDAPEVRSYLIDDGQVREVELQRE